MAEFQERDIDRLLRILDHCDRIDGCIRRFGDDIQSFQNDADYRDAVKMNLFQIGETVNAHGYEKIKEERIWDTVKEDIPVLKIRIAKALADAGVDVN